MEGSFYPPPSVPRKRKFRKIVFIFAILAIIMGYIVKSSYYKEPERNHSLKRVIENKDRVVVSEVCPFTGFFQISQRNNVFPETPITWERLHCTNLINYKISISDLNRKNNQLILLRGPDCDFFRLQEVAELASGDYLLVIHAVFSTNENITGRNSMRIHYIRE